jgi:hypothetical protein
MNEIDTLAIKLTGDATGYDSALKQAEAETVKASGAIGTAYDKGFEKAAASAQQAGRQMTGAMTQAAATAASLAARTAAQPRLTLQTAVAPTGQSRAATGQVEADARRAAGVIGRVYEEGYGKAAAAATKARAVIEQPMKVPAPQVQPSASSLIRLPQPSVTGFTNRPAGSPTGAAGSQTSPQGKAANVNSNAAAQEKDAAKQAEAAQKAAATETQAAWTSTWQAVKVARNLALAYVAFKIPFAINDFINSTVDLGVAARQVGSNILEVRAGMLWAGVTAETMAAAIGTTTLKLDAFKAGSVDAARELDNLAAVSGMTVAQLTGSWVNVYEAIARIEDPTQRAAMAFRYLGGEADKFLDAMAKAGPGESVNVAKRFGLAVNPGDLESLRQVQAIIRQIQTLGVGAFNQILLAVAPMVAELTKGWELTKTSLEWIKPAVFNVAEGVGLFGAFVLDASDNTKLLAAALDVVGKKAESVAYTFKAAMLDALDAVMTKANEMFNILDKNTKVIHIDDLIFGVPDEPKKPAVGEGARQAKADAARKDADAAKALADLVGTVKGGDRGKAVSDFIQRSKDRGSEKVPDRAKPADGVSTAAISQVVEKFKAMAEGLKGPIDIWKNSLREAAEFQKAGFFAGKAGQEARFLQAASMFDKLKQGVGMTAAPGLAGAAEGNTKEAFSAVAQYAMLGQRGNVQDQMKAALDLANQQREAQLEIGRQAAKAMDEMLLQMKRAGGGEVGV